MPPVARLRGAFIAHAILPVVGFGTAQLEFSDCGGEGATLRFTNVEVVPADLPVKLGQKTTFRKSGIAADVVEAPKLRDIVSYTLFGKQRQLWNLTINPCRGIFKETECPLPPGPFAFEIGVTLPRLLPEGEFVDLQHYSHGDGRHAGCVRFAFNTTHERESGDTVFV